MHEIQKVKRAQAAAQSGPMPMNIGSLQTADPEALQGTANQLLSLAKGKGKFKGKKARARANRRGINPDPHVLYAIGRDIGGQSVGIKPRGSLPRSTLPVKEKVRAAAVRGKGKQETRASAGRADKPDMSHRSAPVVGVCNLRQMGYDTGAQNLYESIQQPAQRQHEPYAVNPLPYPPPYAQHAGNPLHAVTPHAASPQAANPLPPAATPPGMN